MKLCFFILVVSVAVFLTILFKKKAGAARMSTGTKIGMVGMVVLAVLIVTPLVWLNHQKVNSVRPNQATQAAEVTADQMAQAKQTAKDFFEALGKGDWDQIAKLCPAGFALGSELDSRQKDGLTGVELVSLGEPFTRAPYPGVFVPYEIRFKNGEVKKFRLAVRQDNPQHQWYFDGGL